MGSAESEDYDQTLDTVFVGPVPEGRHMFVFQADPPDPNKIPVADAVGVTVVLLTCSYRGKEFIRVGYYVNNEYADPELKENPPSVPQFDKLQRNVLATSPRVTRFKIDWGDNPCQDSEPTDSSGQQLNGQTNGQTNGANVSSNAIATNSNSSQHISDDSVGPLKPVVSQDSNQSHHSQSMEVV